MASGRNEPCPCGSGRKYKHCCMKAAQSTDLLWHQQRRLNDDLPARLLAFARDLLGEGAIHQAWRDFRADEAATEFEGSVHDPVFLPWFLYCWEPEDLIQDHPKVGRVTVSLALAYMVHYEERLTPIERRYLETAIAAHFSFHEVVSVEPGRGFVLRDLILETECQAAERMASQNVGVGAILYARVVDLGELAVLDGCSQVLIPAAHKLSILDLRHRIRGRRRKPLPPSTLYEWNGELLMLYQDLVEDLLSPRMPALQNSDGDPFELQELVYDLDDPEAAFLALMDITLAAGVDTREEVEAMAERDAQGRFVRAELPWLKPHGKGSVGATLLGRMKIEGSRLTASVNSRGRAARLRELVETRLGAGARYRATTVQSAERMLAAADAEPRSNADYEAEQAALLADPAIRAHLEATLHAHYQSWIKERIPALGGKTPRQAMRSRAGREKLLSLLDEFERDIARDYPWLERSPILQIREALGLEPGPTG